MIQITKLFIMEKFEKFLDTYFYGFLTIKYRRLLRCVLLAILLGSWGLDEFYFTLGELITFVISYSFIVGGISYVLEPFFKKK